MNGISLKEIVLISCIPYTDIYVKRVGHGHNSIEFVCNWYAYVGRYASAKYLKEKLSSIFFIE